MSLDTSGTSPLASFFFVTAFLIGRGRLSFNFFLLLFSFSVVLVASGDFESTLFSFVRDFLTRESKGVIDRFLTESSADSLSLENSVSTLFFVSTFFSVAASFDHRLRTAINNKPLETSNNRGTMLKLETHGNEMGK
jgi:hypothetical protein